MSPVYMQNASIYQLSPGASRNLSYRRYVVFGCISLVFRKKYIDKVNSGSIKCYEGKSEYVSPEVITVNDFLENLSAVFVVHTRVSTLSIQLYKKRTSIYTFSPCVTVFYVLNIPYKFT